MLVVTHIMRRILLVCASALWHELEPHHLVWLGSSLGVDRLNLAGGPERERRWQVGSGQGRRAVGKNGMAAAAYERKQGRVPVAAALTAHSGAASRLVRSGQGRE